MCSDWRISTYSILLHLCDQVGLCQKAWCFCASLNDTGFSDSDLLPNLEVRYHCILGSVPVHDFKETRLDQNATLSLKLLTSWLKHNCARVICSICWNAAQKWPRDEGVNLPLVISQLIPGGGCNRSNGRMIASVMSFLWPIVSVLIEISCELTPFRMVNMLFKYFFKIEVRREISWLSSWVSSVTHQVEVLRNP